MEDWKFVEKDPSEALARLHFFSVKKKHASGEVEARITVKEFASANNEIPALWLGRDPDGRAHGVSQESAQVRV